MSTTMPHTKSAANPPPKPIPNPTPNHEIEISADYDSMYHLKVGETVRYSSSSKKAGEVTTKFTEKSPFREDDVTGTEVPGAVILTVVSDGSFACEYFITPPDGSRKSIPGKFGTQVTRPMMP